MNPAKPLKVFGYGGFLPIYIAGRHVGQVRAVVAAPSKAAACRAMGISSYDLTNFGSKTWNEEEMRCALQRPGTVYYRPLDSRYAPYIPWEKTIK